VGSITDPMDENYKFARKFEMSVLGEETCDFVNKNFRCRKIELPADGDMKQLKNQARIEVWSATDKKVGVISRDNEGALNKTPFMGFMKIRIAQADKLVKNEIARIQKLRKEKEEAAKKETAKKSE
jgi:hypothetical protein